jgi:hypothetical protein
VRARRDEDAATMTFDPEFGPPPTYMPSVPFTLEPAADLWEVCLWMADRFRALHAEVLREDDA